MKRFQKVLSLVCVLVACINVLPVFAYASYTGIPWDEGGVFGTVVEWIGGTALYDALMGTDHSWQWASSQPQKYYTTPTSSVQDKNGNVTNYYRGGDTTTTNIIDSYNKTFNTIHNTTNNTTTNNYKANVKLENFLNQYTTNNNNYTYSADFKSWYYDNTTNNYNYTTNNLYYNQDNSRYYVSIDNSTDEYYLIDVQYSPTFVTVNYTYNTTNINNEKVGDVTNVYYYELKDGRNSSTLTAAEVAGMDLGYDVANYELVTDDPNTLSLQHFDGDYTDSSSYNRSFYSENRSTQYVDSGAFSQAVKLSSGSAAGVTIPNLSGYSSLSFDFRVYYADVSNLGIYFGNTNLFQEIFQYRSWTGTDCYSDNGTTYTASFSHTPPPYECTSAQIGYSGPAGTSTSFSSQMTVPTSYSAAGYKQTGYSAKRYGWFSEAGSPSLYSSSTTNIWGWIGSNAYSNTSEFRLKHYTQKEYRWTPSRSVHANFSYGTYTNQWISMRITISGGNLYYFVNGDLVGSGSFTKPTADKFYIKSSGTVYLDELRVTTGSLSSTNPYTPSNAPYDTNKVLALPDNLTANTIYVQHNIPVVNHRIGGVRPSNPETGYFYIPLHEDNAGGQPQLYDGSNWVNVTAMVYDGSTLKNALGYAFFPVGESPDVDIDAKPERPEKPGETVDPEKCEHEWELTGGTQPTCVLPGVAEYTCSKCEKTKTEPISKLPHNWEVKQSVQTSYDETGNIQTQGFTIYRCEICGEEYKDTDGTGPPGVPSGGDGSGEEGETIWDKLGNLLGSGLGGILKMAEAVIGGLLDALISLVDMITGKLADVVAAVMRIFQEVPQLFSGFLGFLSAVFPFMPPEITLLLTFGIAAVVFVGIIKAIRR